MKHIIVYNQTSRVSDYITHGIHPGEHVAKVTVVSESKSNTVNVTEAVLVYLERILTLGLDYIVKTEDKYTYSFVARFSSEKATFVNSKISKFLNNKLHLDTYPAEENTSLHIFDTEQHAQDFSVLMYDRNRYKEGSQISKIDPD